MSDWEDDSPSSSSKRPFRDVPEEDVVLAANCLPVAFPKRPAVEGDGSEDLHLQPGLDDEVGDDDVWICKATAFVVNDDGTEKEETTIGCVVASSSTGRSSCCKSSEVVVISTLVMGGG